MLPVLAFLVVAGPAGADEPVSLRDVEREIAAGTARSAELDAEAQDLAARIGALQTRLVAVARKAQEAETALDHVEARLDILVDQQSALTLRLSRRHGQIGKALMALQRLGLYPPDSLVAVRASPTDTLRSGLLLRAIVPALQAETRELVDQLAALDTVRAEIAESRESHAAQLAALNTERSEIEHLLKEMAALRVDTLGQAEKLAKRNAALAEQAKDLTALLHDLGGKVPDAPALKPAGLARPAIRSFAAARGRIDLPVTGRIVQQYGAEMPFERTSRGIRIETRADAQVVAPFDGKIVYAGPFRGYGLILIIEHSDGYHSLLAGFDRIFGAVGHGVLAGEPVGTMGRPENGKPSLYVELRRNGQPINPSSWLVVLKRKENG